MERVPETKQLAGRGLPLLGLEWGKVIPFASSPKNQLTGQIFNLKPFPVNKIAIQYYFVIPKPTAEDRLNYVDGFDSVIIDKPTDFESATYGGEIEATLAKIEEKLGGEFSCVAKVLIGKTWVRVRN